MNWHIFLIIPGVIGAVGFFSIGLILLFWSTRRVDNNGASHKNTRAMSFGGIGMVFFALFIGLFVISAASTNSALKVISILIGLVILIPAMLLLLISLVFFRGRSARK